MPNVASKGTAFAQKGKSKKGQNKDAKKSGEKKDDDDDKKSDDFFKDRECFVCGKKGHGAATCPDRKKKSDSDDTSTSSSNKKSVEELERKLKTVNKQFAQLKSQLEGEDDYDNNNHSHFQFINLLMMNHKPTPDDNGIYNVILKQSRGKL